MLSESGTNSSQWPSKVARRQFSDLVNTELEKVNSMSRLNETLERQNVIKKLVCCGHHRTFFYINVVH